MKNYLKLTGLMLSALLCLFTSCESDDDDADKGHTGGVSSVEVEMLVSSETLKWAEGSFVVTFSPSGRVEEIPVNEIYFAIEANPTTDAEKKLLEQFQSKKVMKTTSKYVCDASDTKVTVTPKLNIKQGTVTTDDVKYDYEVTGVISYRKGLTGVHSTDSHSREIGCVGSGLEGLLKRKNISLVWIDLL